MWMAGLMIKGIIHRVALTLTRRNFWPDRSEYFLTLARRNFWPDRSEYFLTLTRRNFWPDRSEYFQAFLEGGGR